MKKAIFAIILVVAVVLAFLLGMVVNKSNQGNNKASVVGVYKTDSWNGKTGTLVLYEDGTCQYPSGGNAIWALQENTVLITIERSETTQGIITVYFDNSLSDIEVRAIGTTIARLNNVSNVYFVEKNNESERHLQVALEVTETDNKTYNAISQIDGVKFLENIVSEEIVNTSEHEAKIMENGLVLHGQFFEKVSN